MTAMTIHPDQKLRHDFHEAFTAWFKQSGCDFWDECDAPETLAAIAVEVMEKEPTQKTLYLECHITVEPVFGTKLVLFGQLCSEYRFKPADLLMQKRAEDTPERSRHDTFATGRGQEEPDLRERMTALIAALRANDFKVWRYKIEDTLLDSKAQGDLLGLGIEPLRRPI